MKLLSFEKGGRASYGIVRNGKIVHLGTKLRYGSLKALLAAGALGEARALENAKPDIDLGEIKYLPVIPDANKILAIGVNYRAHAAEGGAEVPTKPVVFVRFQNSFVGHNEPILKPRESESYDYEVEFCVVIGKAGRRVPAAEALSHVAGYTVSNDGSVRDWQRHGSQWIPGKNFYQSGAIGPWMVTSDEMPDPSNRRLTTKINGEMRQDSSTSDLIFDVPQLIEYITQFTPLNPGDMILTGTPAGVGNWFKPPRFLKKGDVVEQEIEGIGVLRNVVAVD